MNAAPIGRISMKFYAGDFWETPNLVKVGQKYRSLYMKTQVRFVVAGDTHSP
jgi:hypothetical protein